MVQKKKQSLRDKQVRLTMGDDREIADDFGGPDQAARFGREAEEDEALGSDHGVLARMHAWLLIVTNACPHFSSPNRMCCNSAGIAQKHEG